MSKIGLVSEAIFEDSIDEQNEVLKEISEGIGEGGGSSVVMDEDFSFTSDNGLKNKVITAMLFQNSPNLSISKNSVLVFANIDTILTISHNGNGTLSAESSNTDIVTVAINNSTLTLTGGSTLGEATVTVTCDWATGYKKESITVDVTNSTASSTLSDNPPAVIQSVAKSGQAPNLWSVGDKIDITLNGTVQSLSLNGTYYAFIIGFNHNSDREGTNTIDFQFGKTESGTNIAFCDGSYDNRTSDNYFTMNTSATSSGGWAKSRMRTTVLPSFKIAMPTAWQNVISARTMYTDNTGSASNNSSNMTTTSDDMWLLSEYEVFGKKTYANSAEPTYQKQYTYYANGNSKKFYKHSDISTAVYWWLRSPHISYANAFCCVDSGGNIYTSDSYANYSFGLCPCFRIT